MNTWAPLLKSVEIGDHVIAHTPGAKQPIYANRGADHAAYAGFSAADHIAAANVHANRAKELHIASARQGGSMTLKRQAAQSMHIATTHRQAGMGKPTRLASSMSAKKESSMNSLGCYRKALVKAAGGAGSRGGNVIGRTASGKPIYAHTSGKHYSNRGPAVPHASHVEHAYDAHEYSAQDHRDAEKAHMEHALGVLSGVSGMKDGRKRVAVGKKMRSALRAAALHAEVAYKAESE